MLQREEMIVKTTQTVFYIGIFFIHAPGESALQAIVLCIMMLEELDKIIQVGGIECAVLKKPQVF